MDLFDQIADVETLRADFDDHLIADRVVIDFDGAGMQSMTEYWDRFPSATVHAGTFYLEWSTTVSLEPVFIIVNHEAGAWQIGIYSIDDQENPKWFARVVDETNAVLTLHVLTEVL